MSDHDANDRPNQNDEQFIRKHYCTGQMTLRQCANKMGVARTTLGNWCRKLNVPIRSGSEAQKSPFDRYNNEIRRYHSIGLTATGIANRLGIATSTVCLRLREMNLEVGHLEALDESQIQEALRRYNAGESTVKIARDFGVSHSTVIRALNRRGYNARPHKQRARRQEIWKLGDRIIDLYKAGKIMSEIAANLNCSPTLILRVLAERGVARRDRRGETNPNWNNGTTKLCMLIRRSEAMRKLRRRVFERDCYTCRITGRRGGRLEMHHIVGFARLYEDFLTANSTLDPVRDVVELSRRAAEYAPFWLVENCITLAKAVHRSMHWRDVDASRLIVLYKRYRNCTIVAEIAGLRRQKVASTLRKAGIPILIPRGRRRRLKCDPRIQQRSVGADCPKTRRRNPAA